VARALLMTAADYPAPSWPGPRSPGSRARAGRQVAVLAGWEGSAGPVARAVFTTAAAPAPGCCGRDRRDPRESRAWATGWSLRFAWASGELPFGVSHSAHDRGGPGSGALWPGPPRSSGKAGLGRPACGRRAAWRAGSCRSGCRTPLMTAAVPARGTVKAGDRRDHQESV